ncbi:MAG: glycosyltransferase family 4 protein, partial [bacterium]
CLVRDYKIPEEDIAVIYHGVNLEEFHPSKKLRKDIRKNLKIADQDTLLLFAGKEFRRKGLQYVFEALKILDNDRVKLLIVGQGETAAFKKIAENMGIDNNIIFAGHSDSISKYYAASDIFVFPSTFDAFGMVVLEAMATGLPVIVSKAAGASELIEDGQDGILLECYRDSQAIADKIKLLENIDLRRDMGARARKKAERYSWEVTAGKTMEIFKEVL